MKSKQESKKKNDILFLRLFYSLPLLFIILSLNDILIAQPDFGQQWIKYSSNPLFSFVGEPGNWNSTPTAYILAPGHALQDSNEYKFYFAGFDGRKHSIGLVTSSRLDTGWVYHAENPVLIAGTPGQWDEKQVGNPMVIKDGDSYKMWYTGENNSNVSAIGYATSDDGINWNKYPNNPIVKPTPGNWDKQMVGGPFVIKLGQSYKMWYHGFNGAAIRIGYASSFDGINWTKHDNNPVLEVGESGSWDQVIVSLPIVLFENEKYYMWYVGANSFNIPPGKEQTGFAISDDGITWDKDLTSNPILKAGINSEWDDKIAAALHVFKQNGSYKMLYGGIDLRTNYGVGLAMMEQLVSVKNDRPNQPQRIVLFQNYPNPFNPRTTISYSIPQSGFVELKIYDMLGREMQTIVNGFQQAGQYSFVFDASHLASGLYFYKLQIVNGFSHTKKMLLAK